MNTVDRIPIFLRHLIDISTSMLRAELDLEDAAAREIGIRIAREVCAEHAGEMIYVPTGQALAIHDRDAQMYEFWKGCQDVNRVARRFGVGTPTVYKRLRAFRAILRPDDPAIEVEASPGRPGRPGRSR